MTEVNLSTESIEALATAIIVCTMCICFCLGMNAHRSSD